MDCLLQSGSLVQCPALVVEVLCGDAFCAQKAKKLAEVHIQGSGVEAQERPRHAPGAVITHQFRTPDNRPPQALSLLFASGAVLPAGFLLWGLTRIGANVKVRLIPCSHCPDHHVSPHWVLLALPRFPFSLCRMSQRVAAESVTQRSSMADYLASLPSTQPSGPV